MIKTNQLNAIKSTCDIILPVCQPCVQNLQSHNMKEKIGPQNTSLYKQNSQNSLPFHSSSECALLMFHAVVILLRLALIHQSSHYNLFPGTNANIRTSAASVIAVTIRTISARLWRSLRTNGSRILEKDMNVYSLYPARARMGSRAYW